MFYHNLEQTEQLVRMLEAAVPLRTRLPLRFRLHMKSRSRLTDFPEECWIKTVVYGGDDLGILCQLDLGPDAGEQVFLTAIGHLEFDPRLPETREIRKYQKRRTKFMRRAGIIGRDNTFVPIEPSELLARAG